LSDAKSKIRTLRDQMTLPVFAAPMFVVSGVDLVVACCKAGIVGSLPAANAETPETLDLWLDELRNGIDAVRSRAPHGTKIAPYALNVVVSRNKTERFFANLALIEKHRPPIVISCFGPPGDVVQLVHSYGGLVFHDVATVRHAEKAIADGVDGLIALTSGAGGHTGLLNPFAFLPQLRRFWDGPLLLAGCISDGTSIFAAEALGADFAYMGTRFIATREADITSDYGRLLMSSASTDVVITDRISGTAASFLRGSLARVGLNPDDLPELVSGKRPNLPDNIKAWRNVWSAGQGVGLINDIPTVEELTSRLLDEYKTAREHMFQSQKPTT
jgi:nitronate monooxygenase